MLGQHLDGDRAVQAGVGGFVHLTHAAGAERGFDSGKGRAVVGAQGALLWRGGPKG